MKQHSTSPLETYAKCTMVAGALVTGVALAYPLMYAPSHSSHENNLQLRLETSFSPVSSSYASTTHPHLHAPTIAPLGLKLPQLEATVPTKKSNYDSTYFITMLLFGYSVLGAGASVYATHKFTPLKQQN